MDLTLPPVESASVHWQGLTPVSRACADSYFMPGHGLDESRAVFIEANDLPARFSRLKPGNLFVIGETGFGTGLNCLLAARTFLSHAPAGAHLHLISAERHPLARRDLERALGQWPDLADLASRLIDQYPPAIPGMHRARLHRQVDLALMQGDAQTLWQHCDARVDAWFLDGFAPARNRSMWTRELFATLAERSLPGTTFGTYTAAGDVRRGLQAAGFEVTRREGFDHKRHRLTGALPGRWQPQTASRGRAVVAGAGLAGATTARSLAERGWQVTVCDPALSNEQATPKCLGGVLYATASADLRAQNRFYQTSLVHALNRLRQLGFPRRQSEGRLEGMVQHLVDERNRQRANQAIETGAWPRELLDKETETSVVFPRAGYLHPPAWCRFLLNHPDIDLRAEEVVDIRPSVRLASGAVLEADAVVLCIAGAARSLPGLEWLPLRIVRGQVTFCKATDASAHWRRPHCHAGYLTPAIDGTHSIGATFDRERDWPEIDDADDHTNLATLAEQLPDHWAALGGPDIEVVGHHAGLRCQSPDTLPLCGPLPDPHYRPHRHVPGVWLNIAHGSRGLAHTPLCADLIADALSGHPLPVDSSIVQALAPDRFIVRNRRRDPDWRPNIEA